MPACPPTICPHQRCEGECIEFEVTISGIPDFLRTFTSPSIPALGECRYTYEERTGYSALNGVYTLPMHEVQYVDGNGRQRCEYKVMTAINNTHTISVVKWTAGECAAGFCADHQPDIIHASFNSTANLVISSTSHIEAGTAGEGILRAAIGIIPVGNSSGIKYPNPQCYLGARWFEIDPITYTDAIWVGGETRYQPVTVSMRYKAC